MRRWINALIIAFVFVSVSAFFVWIFVYIRSRPNWQLSAKNTPIGVKVTVTLTDSPTPVYTILIAHGSVRHPFTNRKRTEINSPDVQTVFHDQTVPPGRWTLNLNGTKLDIMEARIIVNDEIEGGPSDIVEVQ